MLASGLCRVRAKTTQPKQLARYFRLTFGWRPQNRMGENEKFAGRTETENWQLCHLVRRERTKTKRFRLPTKRPFGREHSENTNQSPSSRPENRIRIEDLSAAYSLSSQRKDSSFPVNFCTTGPTIHHGKPFRLNWPRWRKASWTRCWILWFRG